MPARFNPPPNWPNPPAGWSPPPGWVPDPSWGPVPEGWQLWVEDETPSAPVSAPGAAAAGPGSASDPGQPAKKAWVARHKILTGAGALLVLIIVIGALSSGGDKETDTPAAADATTQAAQADETTAEEVAASEEADAQRQAEAEASASAKAEADRLAEEQRAAEESAAAEAAASEAAAEAAKIGTVAQQNAYRSAVSYLDFTAFSRKGLADQLAYEGFSAADAEFAIARLEAEGGVDWNEQAAASAANYLEFTSFSHSGLVDQLLYEGFTAEQAEYGVSTTGL